MEEHHSISMLEIARIYYETSTPSTNLKQLARDFFNSIDYDKDGEVSLCEFLNYMKEKGLINMGNRYVFNALDVNGNGSLDFMEVMALYYIIKSGRPFCGGCGNFIPGMFFSCSICFDNEDDTFSVCPMCFSNGNKSYIHQHKPIHFLDNFALLEAKRKVAMATRKAPPPKDHKAPPRPPSAPARVVMKCRDRLHELVKEEIENKDSSTEEWKIVMERSFKRMDNEIPIKAPGSAQDCKVVQSLPIRTNYYTGPWKNSCCSPIKWHKVDELVRHFIGNYQETIGIKTGWGAGVRSFVKSAIRHPRATFASSTTSAFASASTSTSTSTFASASNAIVPYKSEQKEWMWRVTLLESGLNMIGGAVGNAAGAIGGAMAMAGSCNIM
ncbi:unnamed protein product [Camellia sinensis]